MTTHVRTKSNRVAAIAVFALLLATTACGATTSTAPAPTGGVGTQPVATNATLTGGFAGDTYLTADDQYGVGSRIGGATSQTSDAHGCARSGSTCLEP